MKNHIPFLLISLFYISCTKYEDNTPEDLSPGVNWISVKSSSYSIPLNGIGIARLSAFTDQGYNLTTSCTFYVNDQPIDHDVWKPVSLGNYTITAKFQDLTSKPVDIKVDAPLNKKILIESFTSRTCSWCPWIGSRLDSLDQANSNVISYSIHGQDELEIEETPFLQQMLSVYDRPAIRINRGYVRDFSAPIEIGRLIDSVQYFLSSQPPLELSIQTSVEGQSVTAKVFGKYYEEIENKDVISLTLVVVEDSIITQDQYNAFSNSSRPNCPFTSLPFYLSDYQNHNVLRKVLSEPNGDIITKVPFQYGIVQELGTYTFSIDSTFDIENSHLIAIVHRQQDGIEASTVLNSQIVKVGNHVAFNE